jgi:S1-C subfamily serine protease
MRYSFFLSLLMCAAMLGPTQVEVVAESTINETPHSLSQKKMDRRELLNHVRKGVAIIKVSSFASTDVYADTMWSGTGFIVDKEIGLIATNRHVAGQLAACEYEIEFHNGQKTSARLHYIDPTYDFAFLKVDPSKIPQDAHTMPMEENGAHVNDEIYSIGNSAGDKFSLVNGTIFNIYANIGPFDEQSFQYAGITMGGASGSPVVNSKGAVIGIIYGGRFVSGAALPASYIMKAHDFIKQGQLPPRRYLGVHFEYTSIDSLHEAGILPKEEWEGYTKKFPQSNNKVLSVKSVLKDSPASEFLKSGDIIWGVEGKDIGPNLYDLTHMVNNYGDKALVVDVYRDGKKLSLSLKSLSLSLDPFLKFVKFAGTSWYQNSIYTHLCSDRSEPGVFLGASSATSPLRKISSSSWYSSSLVHVTHVDENPIKSIEELIGLIPSLMKKDYFTIQYRNYFGQHVFGTEKVTRTSIRQIVKYNPKFDDPKLYQFNAESGEWDTTNLLSTTLNEKTAPAFSKGLMLSKTHPDTSQELFKKVAEKEKGVEEGKKETAENQKSNAIETSEQKKSDLMPAPSLPDMNLKSSDKDGQNVESQEVKAVEEEKIIPKKE